MKLSMGFVLSIITLISLMTSCGSHSESPADSSSQGTNKSPIPNVTSKPSPVPSPTPLEPKIENECERYNNAKDAIGGDLTSYQKGVLYEYYCK